MTTPRLVIDSPTLTRAFALAAWAHRAQVRKGDDLPYIEHPVAVAELLAEHGYDDEELLAAALLHDTVEDTELSADDVEAAFGGATGARIRSLVEWVSEDKSIEDYDLRKRTHVEHVSLAGERALALFAADKLANLRALRAAYAKQPEALGKRFNAPLDVKLERAREEIEMLRRVAPRLPLLAALERAWEEARAAIVAG